MAPLVDVAAGGGDHADVVVGVYAARNGQTQQFERGVTVLVRLGVAVGEDRADLHAADACFEVELYGQRLGDELLLRQVGQHPFRIDEDGVAAGRPLVRHAVLVEQVAQQLHLPDAGVELSELRVFVQSHGQRVHVAARHAAVGDIAFEHDAEGHGLAEQLLGTHRHEASHVHHAVLLGRNGHDVGVLVDFAHDLLDRLVGVALLAGLDEVGVLGEAGRVDEQGHAVTAAHLGRLADVAHRHGLSSGRVVGDRQHDARNLLAGILAQHLFELGGVHLALEGDFELRVGRGVDRAVHGVTAAVFDMSLRGVEMGVARHDVAFAEQRREDDVLRRAALMRGQEVGHAEQPFDRLPEPEVGGGSGIALVAGHQGGPLAVRHRAGSRIGQQVDRHLVRTQLEEVVVRLANPRLALGAGRGPDRLGHLDPVRFAIG